MKALRIAAVAVLANLGGVPASAQSLVKPLEPPEPTAVTVPGLAADLSAADIRHFDVYFYFYKPGVSYRRAFADFDQCRINTALTRMFSPMPKFVPMGTITTAQSRIAGNAAFPGILGAILATALIAQAEDDYAVATTRQCMAYKGYQRHGTSRKIFEQIETGSEEEKVARKALIASGSAPQSEALDP